MRATEIFQQFRRDMRPAGIQDSEREARVGERHRRAVLSGLTATAARALRVGVSLITIPLTLHYLGAERFGLWMTISSVLYMAGFADFGIGSGVLNTVADASGRDDLDGIRRAISSGFAVLTVIAALLLILFLFTYSLVSWGNLFRVTSVEARAEAGPAMIVFVICFALNLPLDIVQRVQLGLQQGYRTNLWQFVASGVVLIGILLVIHLHAGLPLLVVVFAGAPVLGMAMNMGHFFGASRRDLLPRWHFVSRQEISRIARLGALFFTLQVVNALTFSADNLIVARTLGATSVTLFSIPQRMFSLIDVAVTMLMTPLWPAYGEAMSRGDIAWVRRTLTRTLLGVFISASVASAVLLLLSRRLLLWWVGPQIQPPFPLLLGLALWSVMICCGITLAMFLNGASIVRFQVVTASLFGVSCLATKIFLARRYGISGVPWATFITFGVFIVLPSAFYVPRLLKQMAARAKDMPADTIINNIVEEFGA